MADERALPERQELLGITARAQRREKWRERNVQALVSLLWPLSVTEQGIGCGEQGLRTQRMEGRKTYADITLLFRHGDGCVCVSDGMKGCEERLMSGEVMNASCCECDVMAWVAGQIER